MVISEKEISIGAVAYYDYKNELDKAAQVLKWSTATNNNCVIAGNEHLLTGYVKIVATKIIHQYIRD